MKFRVDFVTNSSSGSFIVAGHLSFPDAKGKSREFKDLQFSTYECKAEEGSWKDSDAPKVFKEYVNDWMLRTGKKTTVPMFLNSVKQIEDFCGFMNSRFGTHIDIADGALRIDRYVQGFGESRDAPTNEYWQEFADSYHPSLYALIESGEHIDIFSETDYHYITEMLGGLRTRGVYFGNGSGTDVQWTKAPFYKLFVRAGKPDLSIEPIRDRLLQYGLSKAAVAALERLHLRVIFALNKSNKNDMFVFMFESDDDVKLLPFPRLLLCSPDNMEEDLHRELQIVERLAALED